MIFKGLVVRFLYLCYINHIRGDLHFKIKKRRQLFNTNILHTWFEMVTCKIDTANVNRFSRIESLPTRTVFSDTHFNYDEGPLRKGSLYDFQGISSSFPLSLR